ncbi:SAM-dependent methyltransferase [Streptomyces sp. NPDC048717]|uniref:SAM-dependent methyltransferase n=1 Tax=Streptomyces sp. NPDC048717 TaxID=3154928 RepID=UPI00341ACFE1
MGTKLKPLARTTDVTVASVARMYNYLLGGKDNYPADRAACETLVEVMPGLVHVVEAQRAFSLAAVDRLSSHHGVRQFLDFGCGLPDWVNTHQVARSSRVVYIDRDPMVVAHGRALLGEAGRTVVVQGDLLQGEDLFESWEFTGFIDFEEPVAIVMASVLHCVSDEEQPAAALRGLLSRLSAGSFLVLSQWVSEDPETRERIGQIMRNSTAGSWGQVRTSAEVGALFGELTLEEPGLGDVSAWAGTERGTSSPAAVTEYGGVGRVQR